MSDLRPRPYLREPAWHRVDLTTYGLERIRRRWRLRLWVPGLGRLHAGLFEHEREGRRTRDVLRRLLFGAVLPLCVLAAPAAGAVAVRLVAQLPRSRAGRALLPLTEVASDRSQGLVFSWELPGRVGRVAVRADGRLAVTLGGVARPAQGLDAARQRLCVWAGEGQG
jgi:hypothetical protein